MDKCNIIHYGNDMDLHKHFSAWTRLYANMAKAYIQLASTMKEECLQLDKSCNFDEGDNINRALGDISRLLITNLKHSAEHLDNEWHGFDHARSPWHLLTKLDNKFEVGLELQFKSLLSTRNKQEAIIMKADKKYMKTVDQWSKLVSNKNRFWLRFRLSKRQDEHKKKMEKCYISYRKAYDKDEINREMFQEAIQCLQENWVTRENEIIGKWRSATQSLVFKLQNSSPQVNRYLYEDLHHGLNQFDVPRLVNYSLSERHEQHYFQLLQEHWKYLICDNTKQKSKLTSDSGNESEEDNLYMHKNKTLEKRKPQNERHKKYIVDEDNDKPKLHFPPRLSRRDIHKIDGSRRASSPSSRPLFRCKLDKTEAQSQTTVKSLNKENNRANETQDELLFPSRQSRNIDNIVEICREISTEQSTKPCESTITLRIPKTDKDVELRVVFEGSPQVIPPPEAAQPTIVCCCGSKKHVKKHQGLCPKNQVWEKLGTNDSQQFIGSVDEVDQVTETLVQKQNTQCFQCQSMQNPHRLKVIDIKNKPKNVTFVQNGLQGNFTESSSDENDVFPPERKRWKRKKKVALQDDCLAPVFVSSGDGEDTTETSDTTTEDEAIDSWASSDADEVLENTVKTKGLVPMGAVIYVNGIGNELSAKEAIKKRTVRHPVPIKPVITNDQRLPGVDLSRTDTLSISSNSAFEFYKKGTSAQSIFDKRYQRVQISGMENNQTFRRPLPVPRKNRYVNVVEKPKPKINMANLEKNLALIRKIAQDKENALLNEWERSLTPNELLKEYARRSYEPYTLGIRNSDHETKPKINMIHLAKNCAQNCAHLKKMAQDKTDVELVDTTSVIDLENNHSAKSLLQRTECDTSQHSKSGTRKPVASLNLVKLANTSQNKKPEKQKKHEEIVTDSDFDDAGERNFQKETRTMLLEPSKHKKIKSNPRITLVTEKSRIYEPIGNLVHLSKKFEERKTDREERLSLENDELQKTVIAAWGSDDDDDYNNDEEQCLTKRSGIKPFKLLKSDQAENKRMLELEWAQQLEERGIKKEKLKEANEESRKAAIADCNILLQHNEYNAFKRRIPETRQPNDKLDLVKLANTFENKRKTGEHMEEKVNDWDSDDSGEKILKKEKRTILLEPLKHEKVETYSRGNLVKEKSRKSIASNDDDDDIELGLERERGTRLLGSSKPKKEENKLSGNLVHLSKQFEEKKNEIEERRSPEVKTNSRINLVKEKARKTIASNDGDNELGLEREMGKGLFGSRKPEKLVNKLIRNLVHLPKQFEEKKKENEERLSPEKDELQKTVVAAWGSDDNDDYNNDEEQCIIKKSGIKSFKPLKSNQAQNKRMLELELTQQLEETGKEAEKLKEENEESKKVAIADILLQHNEYDTFKSSIPETSQLDGKLDLVELANTFENKRETGEQMEEKVNDWDSDGEKSFKKEKRMILLEPLKHEKMKTNSRENLVKEKSRKSIASNDDDELGLEKEIEKRLFRSLKPEKEENKLIGNLVHLSKQFEERKTDREERLSLENDELQKTVVAAWCSDDDDDDEEKVNDWDSDGEKSFKKEKRMILLEPLKHEKVKTNSRENLVKEKSRKSIASNDDDELGLEKEIEKRLFRLLKPEKEENKLIGNLVHLSKQFEERKKEREERLSSEEDELQKTVVVALSSDDDDDYNNDDEQCLTKKSGIRPSKPLKSNQSQNKRMLELEWAQQLEETGKKEEINASRKAAMADCDIPLHHNEYNMFKRSIPETRQPNGKFGLMKLANTFENKKRVTDEQKRERVTDWDSDDSGEKSFKEEKRSILLEPSKHEKVKTNSRINFVKEKSRKTIASNDDDNELGLEKEIEKRVFRSLKPEKEENKLIGNLVHLSKQFEEREERLALENDELQKTVVAAWSSDDDDDFIYNNDEEQCLTKKSGIKPLKPLKSDQAQDKRMHKKELVHQLEEKGLKKEKLKEENEESRKKAMTDCDILLQHNKYDTFKHSLPETRQPNDKLDLVKLANTFENKRVTGEQMEEKVNDWDSDDSGEKIFKKEKRTILPQPLKHETVKTNSREILLKEKSKKTIASNDDNELGLISLVKEKSRKTNDDDHDELDLKWEIGKKVLRSSKTQKEEYKPKVNIPEQLEDREKETEEGVSQEKYDELDLKWEIGKRVFGFSKTEKEEYNKPIVDNPRQLEYREKGNSHEKYELRKAVVTDWEKSDDQCLAKKSGIKVFEPLKPLDLAENKKRLNLEMAQQLEEVDMKKVEKLKEENQELSKAYMADWGRSGHDNEQSGKKEEMFFSPFEDHENTKKSNGKLISEKNNEKVQEYSVVKQSEEKAPANVVGKINAVRPAESKDVKKSKLKSNLEVAGRLDSNCGIEVPLNKSEIKEVLRKCQQEKWFAEKPTGKSQVMTDHDIGNRENENLSTDKVYTNHEWNLDFGTGHIVLQNDKGSPVDTSLRDKCLPDNVFTEDMQEIEVSDPRQTKLPIYRVCRDKVFQLDFETADANLKVGKGSSVMPAEECCSPSYHRELSNSFEEEVQEVNGNGSEIGAYKPGQSNDLTNVVCTNTEWEPDFGTGNFIREQKNGSNATPGEKHPISPDQNVCEGAKLQHDISLMPIKAGDGEHFNEDDDQIKSILKTTNRNEEINKKPAEVKGLRNVSFSPEVKVREIECRLDASALLDTDPEHSEIENRVDDNGIFCDIDSAYKEIENRMDETNSEYESDTDAIIISTDSELGSCIGEWEDEVARNKKENVEQAKEMSNTSMGFAKEDNKASNIDTRYNYLTKEECLQEEKDLDQRIAPGNKILDDLLASATLLNVDSPRHVKFSSSCLEDSSKSEKREDLEVKFCEQGVFLQNTNKENGQTQLEIELLEAKISTRSKAMDEMVAEAAVLLDLCPAKAKTSESRDTDDATNTDWVQTGKGELGDTLNELNTVLEEIKVASYTQNEKLKLLAEIQSQGKPENIFTEVNCQNLKTDTNVKEGTVTIKCEPMVKEPPNNVTSKAELQNITSCGNQSNQPKLLTNTFGTNQEWGLDFEKGDAALQQSTSLHNKCLPEIDFTRVRSESENEPKHEKPLVCTNEVGELDFETSGIHLQVDNATTEVPVAPLCEELDISFDEEVQEPNVIDSQNQTGQSKDPTNTICTDKEWKTDFETSYIVQQETNEKKPMVVAGNLPISSYQNISGRQIDRAVNNQELQIVSSICDREIIERAYLSNEPKKVCTNPELELDFKTGDIAQQQDKESTIGTSLNDECLLEFDFVDEMMQEITNCQSKKSDSGSRQTKPPVYRVCTNKICEVDIEKEDANLQLDVGSSVVSAGEFPPATYEEFSTSYKDKAQKLNGRGVSEIPPEAQKESTDTICIVKELVDGSTSALNETNLVAKGQVDGTVITYDVGVGFTLMKAGDGECFSEADDQIESILKKESRNKVINGHASKSTELRNVPCSPEGRASDANIMIDDTDSEHGEIENGMYASGSEYKCDTDAIIISTESEPESCSWEKEMTKHKKKTQETAEIMADTPIECVKEGKKVSDISIQNHFSEKERKKEEEDLDRKIAARNKLLDKMMASAALLNDDSPHLGVSLSSEEHSKSETRHHTDMQFGKIETLSSVTSKENDFTPMKAGDGECFDEDDDQIESILKPEGINKVISRELRNVPCSPEGRVIDANIMLDHTDSEHGEKENRMDDSSSEYESDTDAIIISTESEPESGSWEKEMTKHKKKNQKTAAEMADTAIECVKEGKNVSDISIQNHLAEKERKQEEEDLDRKIAARNKLLDKMLASAALLNDDYPHHEATLSSEEDSRSERKDHNEMQFEKVETLSSVMSKENEYETQRYISDKERQLEIKLLEAKINARSKAMDEIAAEAASLLNQYPTKTSQFKEEYNATDMDMVQPKVELSATLNELNKVLEEMKVTSSVQKEKLQLLDEIQGEKTLRNIHPELSHQDLNTYYNITHATAKYESFEPHEEESNEYEQEEIVSGVSAQFQNSSNSIEDKALRPIVEDMGNGTTDVANIENNTKLNDVPDDVTEPLVEPKEFLSEISLQLENSYDSSEKVQMIVTSLVKDESSKTKDITKIKEEITEYDLTDTDAFYTTLQSQSANASELNALEQNESEIHRHFEKKEEPGELKCKSNSLYVSEEAVDTRYNIESGLAYCDDMDTSNESNENGTSNIVNIENDVKQIRQKNFDFPGNVTEPSIEPKEVLSGISVQFENSTDSYEEEEVEIIVKNSVVNGNPLKTENITKIKNEITGNVFGGTDAINVKKTSEVQSINPQELPSLQQNRMKIHRNPTYFEKVEEPGELGCKSDSLCLIDSVVSEEAVALWDDVDALDEENKNRTINVKIENDVELSSQKLNDIEPLKNISGISVQFENSSDSYEEEVKIIVTSVVKGGPLQTQNISKIKDESTENILEDPRVNEIKEATELQSVKVCELNLQEQNQSKIHKHPKCFEKIQETADLVYKSDSLSDIGHVSEEAVDPNHHIGSRLACCDDLDTLNEENENGTSNDMKIENYVELNRRKNYDLPDDATEPPIEPKEILSGISVQFENSSDPYEEEAVPIIVTSVVKGEPVQTKSITKISDKITENVINGADAIDTKEAVEFHDMDTQELTSLEQNKKTIHRNLKCFEKIEKQELACKSDTLSHVQSVLSEEAVNHHYDIDSHLTCCVDVDISHEENENQTSNVGKIENRPKLHVDEPKDVAEPPIEPNEVLSEISVQFENSTDSYEEEAVQIIVKSVVKGRPLQTNHITKIDNNITGNVLEGTDTINMKDTLEVSSVNSHELPSLEQNGMKFDRESQYCVKIEELDQLLCKSDSVTRIESVVTEEAVDYHYDIESRLACCADVDTCHEENKNGISNVAKTESPIESNEILSEMSVKFGNSSDSDEEEAVQIIVTSVVKDEPVQIKDITKVTDGKESGFKENVGTETKKKTCVSNPLGLVQLGDDTEEPIESFMSEETIDDRQNLSSSLACFHNGDKIANDMKSQHCVKLNGQNFHDKIKCLDPLDDEQAEVHDISRSENRSENEIMIDENKDYRTDALGHQYVHWGSESDIASQELDKPHQQQSKEAGSNYYPFKPNEAERGIDYESEGDETADGNKTKPFKFNREEFKREVIDSPCYCREDANSDGDFQQHSYSTDNTDSDTNQDVGNFQPKCTLTMEPKDFQNNEMYPNDVGGSWTKVLDVQKTDTSSDDFQQYSYPTDSTDNTDSDHQFQKCPEIDGGVLFEDDHSGEVEFEPDEDSVFQPICTPTKGEGPEENQDFEINPNDVGGSWRKILDAQKRDVFYPELKKQSKDSLDVMKYDSMRKGKEAVLKTTCTPTMKEGSEENQDIEINPNDVGGSWRKILDVQKRDLFYPELNKESKDSLDVIKYESMRKGKEALFQPKRTPSMKEGSEENQDIEINPNDVSGSWKKILDVQKRDVFYPELKRESKDSLDVIKYDSLRKGKEAVLKTTCTPTMKEGPEENQDIEIDPNDIGGSWRKILDVQKRDVFYPELKRESEDSLDVIKYELMRQSKESVNAKDEWAEIIQAQKQELKYPELVKDIQSPKAVLEMAIGSPFEKRAYSMTEEDTLAAKHAKAVDTVADILLAQKYPELTIDSASQQNIQELARGSPLEKRAQLQFNSKGKLKPLAPLKTKSIKPTCLVEEKGKDSKDIASEWGELLNQQKYGQVDRSISPSKNEPNIVSVKSKEPSVSCIDFSRTTDCNSHIFGSDPLLSKGNSFESSNNRKSNTLAPLKMEDLAKDKKKKKKNKKKNKTSSEIQKREEAADSSTRPTYEQVTAHLAAMAQGFYCNGDPQSSLPQPISHGYSSDHEQLQEHTKIGDTMPTGSLNPHQRILESPKKRLLRRLNSKAHKVKRR